MITDGNKSSTRSSFEYCLRLINFPCFQTSLCILQGGGGDYPFNALAPLIHSGNNIRRQYNMAFLPLESLALQWSWFFLGSGVVVFHEYLTLYMQQLGLSLTQISWTSLMGVLQLTLPLLGFLGDRFRARKLVFNGAASGLLHNNPASSLATCRVVADML